MYDINLNIDGQEHIDVRTYIYINIYVYTYMYIRNIYICLGTANTILVHTCIPVCRDL